ncbi:MAG TPA: hypothetical protein DCP37_01315 [Dehalococcoidia bacterium]|nr:hypothetical protein [Dehalococcoidia bacterium]
MEIPSQHAGAGSKQASAPRQDNFIQLSRRTVVLTMAGVMLAMFLASLDQTVVGTAMPRIIADLGGFDSFTWVTTAYLVASTTVVPIVGRLTDMYGRKMFYIAGILVFVTGSVAAGLSGTMNQLILSRALQGVGGGVIMAISFVSIADLFPPEDRGKFQGLMAGVFGLSSVLGRPSAVSSPTTCLGTGCFSSTYRSPFRSSACSSSSSPTPEDPEAKPTANSNISAWLLWFWAWFPCCSGCPGEACSTNGSRCRSSALSDLDSRCRSSS